MIKPYVTKLIFVDDAFLGEMKEQSISGYQSFLEPSLDTEIVSLTDCKDRLEDLLKVVDVSDMKPGVVVARTTYSNQFHSFDSVFDEIQTRKYELLCRFCVALGATKVFVSKEERVLVERASETNIDASLAADSPVVRGSMDLAASRARKSEDKEGALQKFTTTAEGGEPDFETAQRMIDDFKLQRDSIFCDLLEMRKLKTNKLKSHELVMDLSRDVKQLIDDSMMAKIKVMSKIHSGSAGIQTAKKAVENNQSATRLTINVEF